MSGRSRIDWKHAIFRTGMRGLRDDSMSEPPAWNPLGWRRSWTFRATKVYQLAALSRELRVAPPSSRAALLARIASQKESYPPKKDGYASVCNKADIEALEAAAARMLRFIDSCDAARSSRVPPPDIRAPLSEFAPEVRPLYDGSVSATSVSGSAAEPDAATHPVQHASGGGGSGFAISGFGGSSVCRDRFSGGSTTILGAFPEGYGFGFENARTGNSGSAGGSASKGSAIAEGRKASDRTSHTSASSASLALWLTKGREASSREQSSGVTAATNLSPAKTHGAGVIPPVVVVIDDSDSDNAVDGAAVSVPSRDGIANTMAGKRRRDPGDA